MVFLLKFIASVEICFVTFPMQNPAVVCQDTLKTDLPHSAYSLVPGECVIYFILFFLNLFLTMLYNVLTEVPPLMALLND